MNDTTDHQRKGLAEGTLIDLWRILARHKWLIASVLVLVLAAASTFLLLADPIYESHAVVQIGTIDGRNIESVDTVVSKLSALHIPKVKSARNYPFVESIEKEKQLASDLITMTARGLSPEQAKHFLGSVIDQLNSQHHDQFNRVVAMQQRRFHELEITISAHRQQAASLAEAIRRMLAINPVQAAITEIERAEVLGLVATLEAQRIAVELILSDINTRDTSVVLPPTMEVKPVAPKVKLLLALSLMVGTMIGVMLALVLELVQNAKRHG